MIAQWAIQPSIAPNPRIFTLWPAALMPLAYFITFSTYGTWLRGTSKGVGSVDDDHNLYGSPFIEPNTAREMVEREAMSQSSYTMDAARRAVVCDAVVELSREKGWRLHAVHVRTNHVHIIISANRDPGRLMSELKARASRNLNRAGLDSADRRRWTRHGSTRHLFDGSAVEAKVRYTLDEQGERMAWYEGTHEPRP